MQHNFDKELKWFTKKLLQIRILDVKGFHLPVPFEISEISVIHESDEEMFSSDPKEHLEDMIEEIRGHFPDEKIRLEYSNNFSSVKIFGLNSKRLSSFLTEGLECQTSLFETRANSELFYVELPTDIILSPSEAEIFSELRLKKDNNSLLSYNEIFEICASHKGIEQQSYRNNNSTEDLMNTAARGAISHLLRKIKSSPMFRNITKDKIIKNVREEGYSLKM